MTSWANSTVKRLQALRCEVTGPVWFLFAIGATVDPEVVATVAAPACAPDLVDVGVDLSPDPQPAVASITVSMQTAAAASHVRTRPGEFGMKVLKCSTVVASVALIDVEFPQLRGYSLLIGRATVEKLIA